MKFTKKEAEIIQKAIAILDSKATKSDLSATSPGEVKTYCRLQLGALEHEVFAVLFLNNRHELIKFEQMFRGTIDQSAVYPREVAKEALSCNCAAVIFSHNHPSGIAEPSEADKAITRRLVTALDLLDIRVLDHIVVGIASTVSFAERGLL